MKAIKAIVKLHYFFEKCFFGNFWPAIFPVHVFQNFTEARVEHVDPEALLNKISKSIEDMMFNKISALKVQTYWVDL